MTKEEIIEMARQVGFFINDELTITSPFIEDICISPMLKEFAKLVIEHERGKYTKLYEEEIRSIREAATQYGIPSEDAAGMLLFCEEFARMIAEKEREACAKIAEEPWQGSSKAIAEQIRARGQE